MTNNTDTRAPGLTDERIDALLLKHGKGDDGFRSFARAIEREVLAARQLDAPAAAPANVREAVARAICTACEENPDHKGDARGRDFRWQDYLEVADAAIAAAPLPATAQDVAGWQPIETVPKDGSEVLLYLAKPYNRIVKARWFDLWENWIEGGFPDVHDEHYGIGSRFPTHWMPAPPAPTTTKEQQA